MKSMLGPRRLAPLLLMLAMGLVALIVPVLIAAQQQPPSIPHPVEGREACLVCHAEGVAGAPAVPADHEGRGDDTCRLCHQLGPAAEDETPAATATGEPTESPTATTVATSPAATATAEPTATAETVTAAAEAGPAPVPHTLEGRENCLTCHLSSEAHALGPSGPPAIPHPLVGRDNCLACHESGIGGATIIPADHQGRGNETCQGCHQASEAAAPPTATPPTEPIPTPPVFTKPAGIDTCVDCHQQLPGKQAEITEQWQRSIHGERDISCANCHGGDPSATTVDDAMSPEAGYIGAPAKADIPALCASCHADVNLMRQYDLPTDQYAKYRESIHGTRLAEGDENVATCSECHGGHQVLKANDPASTVYPANVPEMCAGCHADQTLMAPYGIPTNQFDLYRQSVHGHALLDRQDFRAPNCATCHGTHGAAPPGFAEVANVCGSCHTATQDYYLESPHADAEGQDAPKCVTCHGRYDVGKPSEALYLGAEPRHCGSCHAPETEGGQLAQTLYDEIDSAARAYEEAEIAIETAARVGMLVTAQESLLQQSNTNLVTARAAQHTLDAEQVANSAGLAREAADEAKAGAQAAIDASILRRRAMIVAVAAIGLTIVALYILKREMDRRLEAEG